MNTTAITDFLANLFLTVFLACSTVIGLGLSLLYFGYRSTLAFLRTGNRHYWGGQSNPEDTGEVPHDYY